MTPDPEPPDLPPPPVPPVGEAVGAEQVATHAAAPRGHHQPIHTHCENCGTALQGPFCHHCGQHDFDFHRSFGHAVHDALENFFHFDTKLFRNTVTLLFRPGVLSAEFNAGHRAAQMPPLRLYIFVSILFFFVEFANPPNREGIVRMDAGDRAKFKEALAETRANPPQNAPAGTDRKVQEKPDPRAAHPENAASPDTKKTAKGKPPEPESGLEAAMQEKGRFIYEHQEEVREAFIHAIPKMLLFCLPFFALYTRGLFRQAGHAYLPHFVVALHFHTFIFLWVMLRNGWSGLAGLASPVLGGGVEFGCNLWLAAYPVIMLRRLFGNSWKRTIFKGAVLTFAYSLTLALAFTAAALVILATL